MSPERRIPWSSAGQWLLRFLDLRFIYAEQVDRQNKKSTAFLVAFSDTKSLQQLYVPKAIPTSPSSPMLPMISRPDRATKLTASDHLISSSEGLRKFLRRAGSSHLPQDRVRHKNLLLRIFHRRASPTGEAHQMSKCAPHSSLYL